MKMAANAALNHWCLAVAPKQHYTHVQRNSCLFILQQLKSELEVKIRGKLYVWCFLKAAIGDRAKLNSKDCRAYVLRQRPLYYNCYLIAPDGESLCTCDIKKAEWYIEKGLAGK